MFACCSLVVQFVVVLGQVAVMVSLFGDEILNDVGKDMIRSLFYGVIWYAYFVDESIKNKIVQSIDWKLQCV